MRSLSRLPSSFQQTLTSEPCSGGNRDRQALGRALTDLSGQIVDLKRALREVTNERDNLRSLRRSVRLDPSTLRRGWTLVTDTRKEKQGSPTQSDGKSVDQDSLHDRLLAAEQERDRYARPFIPLHDPVRDTLTSLNCRLTTLVSAAEGEIYFLHRRAEEQEAEFEQVAERVRLKLEEYREKVPSHFHRAEAWQLIGGSSSTKPRWRSRRCMRPSTRRSGKPGQRGTSSRRSVGSVSL